MRCTLYLLIVALFSCSGPPKEAIPLETFKQQVDSLFNAHIDDDGPGAALLIAYENEALISKGYGLRNLELGEPLTPKTNMRMGSVSKQFTALSILSLVDEGIISLEDPVSKYLPYEVFENITIEHLLNHTSGIADYEESFMMHWDTTQIAQNRDVLEWYAKGPLPLFIPGERWEYSNGAYNLLATLVENASGTEFSRYAKERVFERANMSETNYFNLAKPVKINERASCYEKDENGQWERVDGHFLNGCLGEGAVYTNLEDFFKYDQALREKRLLSEATHGLIFKPSSMSLGNDFPFSFHDGRKVFYGMGQFVTYRYAFHGGGWYGTRTFVYRELQRPLTIAIFLNSDGDFLDLMNGTFDLTKAFIDDQ